MAQALRLQRPGGRYHVTVRGNERKAVFRAATDRHRFLELLGALAEGFGVLVHAYMLMDNYFHEFRGRNGDWGRDAALWLGRGAGRLSLARLGGSWPGE